MKNYYSENLVFWRWIIRSIISGTVATISMVIFIWGFLFYAQEFSSQEFSNSAIRGVGAIIMLTPVLIGWHSFLYCISYYFLRSPKKIIDIFQLMSGLVFLFLGYVITIISVSGFRILNLEEFLTLISSFIFMLVPLVLGFIMANSFEKLLIKY